MSEFDRLNYLSIKLEPNEPSYLAGLLTNTYFNEYYGVFDDEMAANSLITEFYMMHYGGKNIDDEKIEQIVTYFRNNLPLLINCVYLFDIKDDDSMRDLCAFNPEIIYKIILDVYNDNCPVDKKLEYSFDFDIDDKIIEIVY